MEQVDVKDSWKGKIWFFYFILPLLIFLLFTEVDYENLVGEELFFLLFLIFVGLFWLIGLYFIIKKVKKEVKNS